MFLHDLDEVKLGVITHFSEFMKVPSIPSVFRVIQFQLSTQSVSPSKRKDFLPILQEIQHSPGNWRFRKLIARQLGNLAALFDAEVTQRDIVPFSLALIGDGVASVRKNAQLGVTLSMPLAFTQRALTLH